jgi:hypothetical protein
VTPGAYDPALEAFVAVELERADPRIRVTPIDGRPTSVAAVALPAGHTPVSAARGSGRAFALTRDGAGSHHLTWWDAVSGAAGGTRPVGAVPDGMHASSNGRVLALWDLRGYRATLVDTAAPDLARTLRLGICRGAGLSEASADGRWFLLADCFGNLRIADLAATSLVSSPIGVKQQGRVAFALDGAEIVWLGEDGVVHALDAASRERVELARLEDEPLDPFDLWYRRVVVHRATNLLAVVTGSGMVRTTGLPGAATPRPAAELPFLDLSGAALDLTAAPIDAGGADTYEFHGTFTASGAGATGDVAAHGRVHARGLHRYLPTEPTVAPAALPPPHLYALASAVDPDSGAELFTLDFGTPNATPPPSSASCRTSPRTRPTGCGSSAWVTPVPDPGRRGRGHRPAARRAAAPTCRRGYDPTHARWRLAYPRKGSIMSFGNILGQLLEQGISGQSQTQARLGTSARNMAQGGQGFEQILGSLQSMLGARRRIPSGRHGRRAEPLRGARWVAWRARPRPSWASRRPAA